MKSYFAYIRVSTVRQGEHGSSLQEQRSAIEAYAARHELSISQWIEETETAAKGGRPRFNKLIADLRRGRAAGVVIHKIDRSARNLRDWGRLGELADHGVEVHFAHETIDLGTRGGRLAADIQAVVAADFIRNLREETRKGFYGRLKQGIYPLRAPIGYVDCGGGKAKEPHPILGPLVRQAFEEYATARYSLDDLRRVMHGRGLVGHSGRGLSRNGMATILHNPFYIGVLRLHKTGEAFQGIHTPIVACDLFERVQDVLAGRHYRRPVRHTFWLSRIMKCAACGRSLIGELQKGHVYYRCHTLACRGTGIAERDVYSKLRMTFGLLAFSEQELRDLRDFGDNDAAGRESVAEARRGAARLALGKCDERMKRLTDAFLDATIDKETFEARKASLLIERRGHLDAIEGPSTLEDDDIMKNVELGNTAQLRLETKEVRERRELVGEVMSNLTVTGKNLDFRLRFPFDEVAKWRLHRECDRLQAEPRTWSTLCTDEAPVRTLYDHLKELHEERKKTEPPTP